MGPVIKFKKRYRILLLILTILMVILGVFGENGLITLMRLKEEYREVISENEAIKKSNQSLYHEIYLLKEDRYYIEKIAREEMGLVKKDEIILRFEK